MSKNINNYTFIELKKSDNPKKKFDVIFKNNKTNRTFKISFGASGYLDLPLYYLYYRDTKGYPSDEALEMAERKRANYLKRHQKEDNDNFDNWYKPGWWAANLLWGDIPDVKKQLAYLRKKYDI